MNSVIPPSTGTSQIRLSELLGALSHALDMVEGQPAGHNAEFSRNALADVFERMAATPNADLDKFVRRNVAMIVATLRGDPNLETMARADLAFSASANGE